MSDFPEIHWVEQGEAKSARWRSESAPPPRRVEVVDDTVTADAAYRLASEGCALLWRGDFQNARQLLQAMARRVERRDARRKPPPPGEAGQAHAFHLYRQAQAQRARTLGMLLLPLDAGYKVNLRRAPDMTLACAETWGEDDAQSCVASLRELLGLVGAHEWRRKGVEIPALGARIHPYYGVFSPLRGEYIGLVAQAPLPDTTLAFDIGTGTGVLAALLAHRGVARVVATDIDERALACARDNVARLGFAAQVSVERADLFPQGRAPLIVCNPPWLPARPSSTLERSVYDPDSAMLRAFLAGVPAHLTTSGEAWLILSDFAEHLGLRARNEVAGLIDAAGLAVLDRLEARAQHPRAADRSDPLYEARRREVTTLWRLVARAGKQA
jgi:SAM-dependent methyltransferase